MSASVVLTHATVAPIASRTVGDFADQWRRQYVISDPLPGPVVMPSGLFGPWLPGIPEPDRRAGLRCLAGLAAVFCGSRDPVVTALRRAELSPDTAGEALALFDKIPSRRRREILATYAAIMR
jgi:hypothetical protein